MRQITGLPTVDMVQSPDAASQHLGMSDDSPLPHPHPQPVLERRGGRPRPADACPHPRPFPPGFADCPAFEPAPFASVTTGHRDLEPVLSCVNLQVRQRADTGGHYPACRLGSAADRLRRRAEAG